MSQDTSFTFLTHHSVQASPRVLTAYRETQIHYRDPMMKAIYQETKNNLKKILKLSDAYDIIFLPCGSKGVNESVIASLLVDEQSMVIPSNGQSGECLAEIANRHHPSIVSTKQFPVSEPLPVEDIMSFCEESKPKTLSFVSHEISHGMQNGTAALATAAKDNNYLIMLEANSSVVVEDIDYEKLDIDAITFTSTTAMRSVGTVGIVAIKKDLINRLPHPNIHYLDLKSEYRTQESDGWSLQTIDASLVRALHEATEELLEQGVENRRKEIHSRVGMLTNWVVEKGLRLCVPREHIGGYTVALHLPDGWTYSSFIEKIKREGYFVQYGHEGYEGTTISICPAGHISDDDVHGFINAAGKILNL